ncbi:sigma 54-interacting transcriptional regulator [Metabacillus elymi]|uniref:Sigma-54-dependent Fis family transcriptional regulator n=1 Tax=Metabacillus elymi TaxID=2745198 RepID=A0ABX6S8Y9_9BACI|nr:sigma 54-interacting transcriptional regulator [Metabacillus sp. KUDC1714]QNF30570.1 sigma-54-dependent Fis family transcriptional regulator [Metabacillus sp. KUDC1714]
MNSNKSFFTCEQVRNFSHNPLSSFSDIISEHPSLLENVHIAKKIALTDFPILIHGATGTGKDLFAQAIHTHSPRKNCAFVTVDCKEHNAELLEEELFGYEDISNDSSSLFDLATGGTIFFNNIGDLSPKIQTKILSVIENKGWRRLNGSRLIPLNVRFISATNKHLALENDFRDDLLYRLNVLSISLPEVKEIKQDIQVFIEHFLAKSGSTIRIDQAVQDALNHYDWPGNIREIKNTVDYMLTVSDGRSIQLHDLPHGLIRVDKQKTKKPQEKNTIQLTMMDKLEYAFILEEIKLQNEKGEPASRRVISENSKSLSNPLTTQQVRHRLDFLEKHHYVTKGRGRAGTKITLEGVDFLLSLKEIIK